MSFTTNKLICNNRPTAVICRGSDPITCYSGETDSSTLKAITFSGQSSIAIRKLKGKPRTVMHGGSRHVNLVQKMTHDDDDE